MTAELRKINTDRTCTPVSTSTLSDKDRFDALLKLRDAWRVKWDARVASEWKITFGVWTLLALGIAQVMIGRHVAWFLPVIVIAAHAYVLLQIRYTNARDGKICLHYLREAERLVVQKSVLPESMLERRSTSGETFLHYTLVAQIVASTILGLAILIE